jgi:hypothetical protein
MKEKDEIVKTLQSQLDKLREENSNYKMEIARQASTIDFSTRMLLCFADVVGELNAHQ